MNPLRFNKLRQNATDPSYRSAVNQLRARAQSARALEYSISDRERGDWTHMYYCRHDGARLQFDWSSPTTHPCPVCARKWSGEPFDGAWVTLAHSQLGTGLRDLAVYSLVANDKEATVRVKDVLLTYAKHYAGYETHGNIPYNGPGKLFAQTLDEAHWIIDLCYAYRLVRDVLTEEERQEIDRGLLQPCAAFLIHHKEHQLHNHALLITSAICILGFLLKDEAIHCAGLEGAYGLRDQLNRGVLEDGMWYEGNFQYHFYGYHSLLQYCVFVEGTSWDLLAHPTLKRMFDFPLSYVLPDGSLPNLNDASYRMTLATLAPYYEMAYAWYRDETYLELLRLAYGMEDVGDSFSVSESFTPVERDSLEALWYGEALEATKSAHAASSVLSLKQRMAMDSTSAGSGLTKLVNPNGWHLLVKHSVFGGEHDHMDRLSVSFGVGGRPLFIDPGTTAYGVPAHYGWFKHTYSHNTVCLNGKDQPPADGHLVQYHREIWGSWVETAVEWQEECYRMKGLITLPPEMCPWEEQVYHGASIRRLLVLTDQVLLDVVRVMIPEEREIDLLYHMSGELRGGGAWQPFERPVSALSQEWLQKKQWKQHEKLSDSFCWGMGDGLLLQASWCSDPSELIMAQTPDNPPSGIRQTLIHRVQGTALREVLFIHAFSYVPEAEKANPAVLKLRTEIGEEGRRLISLGMAETEQTWILEWTDHKAALTVVS